MTPAIDMGLEDLDSSLLFASCAVGTLTIEPSPQP